MDQNQDGTREQLLALLLDKIDEDTYPSVTMMDLVEEILRPDEVPEYAEILMAKIRADQYPSMELMSRVRSLA